MLSSIEELADRETAHGKDGGSEPGHARDSNGTITAAR
jgi:hypothetical protein